MSISLPDFGALPSRVQVEAEINARRLARLDMPRVSGSESVVLEKIDMIREYYPDYCNPEMLSALESMLPDAKPPSNNMGVNYPSPPHFLPHGEILDLKVVQKTKIDWLGFTSCVNLETLQTACQVINPEMSFRVSPVGMKGYPLTQACCVGTVQVGLIGHGAKHGRNHASFPGGVWDSVCTESHIETIREMLELIEARLNRIDICLDFYHGEISFDYALFAFENGAFKRSANGPQPKKREMGDTGPDGENLGRTLYIGPRDGEVYGRVYEKGLELFAKMPEAYRQQSLAREQSVLEQKRMESGGAPSRFYSPSVADDLLRIEVEFKRKNKERDLPLDMLTRRDEYFAGAYPFCASSLGVVAGCRPSTLKQANEFTHDKLIGAHRNAYGNHVHSLREIGFTDQEICDLLDTGCPNQKLLKAGVIGPASVAYKEMLDRRTSEFDNSLDVPF